LAKLFWQKKFESVYLDTFAIPIPLPAGGSHWVFDSQITPFPWDDPPSLSCPMIILLKKIVGRLLGNLTEKQMVCLPTCGGFCDRSYSFSHFTTAPCHPRQF
jgi:hypothetical protein